MASYTLSPIGGAGAQFFDNSGNPLTGGKLYTYLAGTTTPAATFTTPVGSANNTNPIILDAAGRPPQEIWLNTANSYKFVIKTSTDTLIATYDNIPSLPQPAVVNDASAISYEQGNTVLASSLIAGRTYMIATLGNTDFTLVGAAYNSVGVVFTATGSGSGTGTAYNSRTVANRLQDTVSVVDFGAYKDGTNATQTTAAIQAAIDYAKAHSNIHCIEFPTGNYAVNATLNVKGNFGYGFFIKGNKSTITASHNGIVFDCDSGSPEPAPAYRLNFNISDMTIVGPGKTNANAVGIKLYGANYSLNHVMITGFHRALYGHGCLISEFVQCKFENSEYGIWFDFDGFFAPNDNHFYKCNIITCVKAIKYIDFDYGSVTFIGCEIEGNNLSGNATDGVKVCEFGVGPAASGAGELTFVGCHWESNPGQYNLFYDSPGGRHLNIIGCKMIPGDITGSVVYIDNGELSVTGSHIVQNVGGNIVLTANTGSAMIVGDTAGTVTGTLTKLVRVKQGQINAGGMSPGATAAGLQSKGYLGVGAALEGSLQFNNSSGSRLGYIVSNGIVQDASAGYTISTGNGLVSIARSGSIGIDPGTDNTLSNGSAALRWSTVYAGTGTINTSDERSKQQTNPVPQEWLDAWGDVEYMRFKYNDAVAEKGPKARWHVGLIAQRVKEAFEKRGIDPFAIGLLCYDKWEDVVVEEVLEGANGLPQLDANGDPMKRSRVVKVAGDQYGIRYEEALALECAYLRSKLKG